MGCQAGGAAGPAGSAADATAATLDAAPDATPADQGGAPDGGAAQDGSLPAADASAPYPLAPPGPGFHRHGDALLDEQGRTIALHGVNVANAAKYRADHLPWQGPEQLAELAALGLNSVRLLTFWGVLMPQEGVIDETYLAAFADRVDWAGQAGLLVVVDMHQDIFGFGFGDNGAPRWACDEALYASYQPQQPWYVNYLAPEVQACFDRFYADDALFDRFVEAWVALARRLGEHPAVLGFDLLNEPSWGSGGIDAFVPAVWQPRLEQLSAAIHAVAPRRPTFYQGTTLASVGHVDAFRVPSDPRLAFAPHYYHPLVHDGAAWDDSMLPALDGALVAIDRMAGLLGGPPVWVGEFGGPGSAAGFDRYLEDLLERFTARRWGWAYYSDDPTDAESFGIRNPDHSFRPAAVQRLGHPYARRVPGRLLASRLDLAGGGGVYEARFRWELDAPLELWVGPDGQAEVREEGAAGVGAALACAPAAGAPAGVLLCPAGGGSVRFGAVYSVRLSRPAAAQ